MSGILVALVVFVVLFLVGLRTQDPQSQKDAGGYLVYENPTFGFNIRYPNDAELQEYWYRNTDSNHATGVTLGLEMNEKGRIDIQVNSPEYQCTNDGNRLVNSGQEVIAGKQADFYRCVDDSPSYFHLDIYRFTHNGLNFQIFLQGNIEEAKKILISSVNFTPPTFDDGGRFEGMQFYSDEDFGFSFFYPAYLFNEIGQNADRLIASGKGGNFLATIVSHTTEEDLRTFRFVAPDVDPSQVEKMIIGGREGFKYSTKTQENSTTGYATFVTVPLGQERALLFSFTSMDNQIPPGVTAISKDEVVIQAVLDRVSFN